jgi:hypothetical protein
VKRYVKVRALDEVILFVPFFTVHV